MRSKPEHEPYFAISTEVSHEGEASHPPDFVSICILAVFLVVNTGPSGSVPGLYMAACSRGTFGAIRLHIVCTCLTK